MTALETVLLGAASGLLAALTVGSAAYIRLARTIMTRAEHDKECQRVTGPINRTAGETKESILRLEGKFEQSSTQLQADLRKILVELIKMNKVRNG